MFKWPSLKVVGEISKSKIRLMVRCRNRKCGGNIPKEPDSLNARLEMKKIRHLTENLDDKYGDLEEGCTPAEATVADLGSVNDRALGFLATVSSEEGNDEDTVMM